MAEVLNGYNPEVSLSQDDNGYKITRTYYVENDDFSDGMEYRIVNLAGIPQSGDNYPDAQIDLPVISRKAEPYNNDEGGDYIYWKVTIEYGVPSDDDNGGQTGAWSTDLRFSSRSQQYEVPFEKAYDDSGKLTVPVESTTGEPLIGVSKYDAKTLLEVSYNVGSFDVSITPTYTNSINASNVSIAGVKVQKGKGRIIDINSSLNTDGLGNTYYAMSITIEVVEDDHNIKPMNRGFMRQSAGSESLEYIIKEYIATKEVGTDIGAERIDEPAKLDKDSNIITGDTAYYIPFKAYPSLSWNTLQIPSSRQS